jgi:hypothetical protein
VAIGILQKTRGIARQKSGGCHTRLVATRDVPPSRAG